MKRMFIIVAVALLVCVAGLYAWVSFVAQPIRRQLLTQNRLLYVGTACSRYFVDEGESPESLTDLFESPGKKKVYLERRYAWDAWGHPIQIIPFDAALGCGTVISYGRDGLAGGEGFDADVQVRFGKRTR